MNSILLICVLAFMQSTVYSKKAMGQVHISFHYDVTIIVGHCTHSIKLLTANRIDIIFINLSIIAPTTCIDCNERTRLNGSCEYVH